MMTILLVDDNPVNLMFAQILLDKMNCRVKTATTGLEAIAVLKSEWFDLVLMDVKMPEMDGFAATRVIRDRDSEVLDHQVPIVAMTACTREEERVGSLEAGMDDFLPKPVRPDVLRELVDRYRKKS